MHYIRTEVVNALILRTIRRVVGCVKENESAFAERVREASNLRAEAEVKESKKRLAKAERRVAELDKLVTKLYETYALGKLPENHFGRMLAEYDDEQKELRRSITDLRSGIDNYAADRVRAAGFIKIVRHHTEVHGVDAHAPE